jgi:hypothetical protein
MRLHHCWLGWQQPLQSSAFQWAGMAEVEREYIVAGLLCGCWFCNVTLIFEIDSTQLDHPASANMVPQVL